MKSPRAALGAVMAAIWILALRLAAQDVTVGEPGWFSAEGIPDVAPQGRKRLHVEYPGELRDRRTGETGYVLVARYLDADGRNDLLEVRSAYPWFKQAVEDVLDGWSMRPARRGGQAVASWFWVPIIFNAAPAGTKEADAAPRLLAVSPVIVPPALMKKLRGNTTAWGAVSLDAAGVPVKVALEPGAPDQVLPYVEAALKAWRFAPERKGGQPAAGELRVAFLFYEPADPIPVRVRPPVAIRKTQVAPEYPYAMRRYSITGQVVVAFVVDREGRVANPVVYQSTNPAFTEPAIKAVLQWRFEPASVDGRAVSARLRVPIVFTFNDGSGREIYTVEPPDRKTEQRMPEQVRYDVPPKLQGVAEPVFPYAALRDRRTGKAALLLAVNAQGEVGQTKVIEATRPEFGLALVAAVDTYKFTPALKDGRPTTTVLRLEREFELNGPDALVTSADLALLRREQKRPDSFVGPGMLDAPLRPLSRQPPIFPVALRPQVGHGQARVEFLVDEEGHARLPRILEASDPAFGYAAVQAVGQWLFDPPRSHGRPAVVRVVVPFEFEAKPPVMGTAVGEPPADGDGK